MNIFLKCIEKSHKLINDIDFLNRNRTYKKYFTRNRKMNFVKIIGCLLNFMRKSTSLELLKFHELVGCEGFSMTKQAFSKARQHIKPEAFKELVQVSAETFLNSNQAKRYKGFRVFAIDGTELEVEPTPDNLDYFGHRGSAEKACRARASVLCDVFDGVLIDTVIASSAKGERELAMGHVEYFWKFADRKDLILLDRGYPSKEFIKNFLDKDIKFLMRLQKSFNSEIDLSTKRDFYIKMEHKVESFNVRVIKFVLESGEEEILITNLARNSFKMKEFKDLYFLRWAIETKYNTLKNSMLVENFTRRTKVSVEQDFYATMYLANLVAFAKMESNIKVKEATEGKKLKNEYKTNEKMLIGMLKDKLILMLLCPSQKKRDRIFKSIITEVSRYRTEIRPGRQYDRPKDAHHRKRLRRKNVL